MEKTKVFHLIKSFSEKEAAEFRKLIASPLYSKGRNYLPILDEIILHNRRGHENLSREQLFEKLYPGKKFSSQTMKNRFSELFKLGEEFLAYNHLNKKVIEKEKILTEEYLNRSMLSFFESKYRKTKKLVEQMPDNEYKFRNISFLNSINLSLLNNRSRVEKMYKQYYDTAEYSLLVFLVEIFQHGIEFVLEEYDGRKFEKNIIKDFLQMLNIKLYIERSVNTNDKMHRMVRMFYYLYKAYENPGADGNYFESRKLFRELLSFFTDEFKNEIYKSMISYCIIRQNSGAKKFQHELFDLYNEKLKQGLYSEFKKKMFPVNTFRDYVFIGIAVKEFRWVENLIRNYSKELPVEIREDEVNLSYAQLFFANRHFDRALNHLNRVNGKNYIHYLDSSVMKLCSLYEMERYEDAFFEIDKFRHYLRNHKEIPVVHRDPKENFARLFQKFLNAITKPDKTEFGMLRKEIAGLKSISKKNWLLEKIPD